MVASSTKIVFTFHNVSINTSQLTANKHIYKDLHSTMFLLILLVFEFVYAHVVRFTFHNVSINTRRQALREKPGTTFTFHNVSINTDCMLILYAVFKANLHSTMFLLIRCQSESVQ